MRRRAAIMLMAWVCCGLVAGSPCRGEEIKLTAQERAAAEKAVVDWLALTDRGDHAGALKSSSNLFQASVKPQKWIAYVGGLREPLGAFITRTAFSIDPASVAFNYFPTGRYVFVKYLSEFENKSVNERVVVVWEEPGRWRMCGYKVIPRGAPIGEAQKPPEQTGPPSGASRPADRSRTGSSSGAVGTITIKPPKAKQADTAQ